MPGALIVEEQTLHALPLWGDSSNPTLDPTLTVDRLLAGKEAGSRACFAGVRRLALKEAPLECLDASVRTDKLDTGAV